MKKADWFMMSIVAALMISALLFAAKPKDGSERFSGADGQAEGAISALSPTYQPWIKPFWEPPSGEVESLLFSLQASLGAAFLGYFFGRKSKISTKSRNSST